MKVDEAQQPINCVIEEEEDADENCAIGEEEEADVKFRRSFAHKPLSHQLREDIREEFIVTAHKPLSHQLLEDELNELREDIREEFYSELEALVEDMNAAIDERILQQKIVSREDGAAEGASAVENDRRILDDLTKRVEEVQERLKGEKLQSKLQSLRKMQGNSFEFGRRRKGKKRRPSKLLYYDMADVRHGFYLLKNILVFLSCAPPIIFVFVGGIVYDNEKYYHICVSAWPIEALFVMVHFLITIERSTMDPNSEEKVHFIAHYISHWASILTYQTMKQEPSFVSLLPMLGLMLLTSAPLYYLLKRVRGAIQQFQSLKGTTGNYVDEVFSLLMGGVLVPLLYLFFETTSSWANNAASEGMIESYTPQNNVAIVANLSLSVHLLELGLFNVAILGTGIASVRDLMCFSVPRFLQVAQLFLLIAGCIALFLQGSKESDDGMPKLLEDVLWHVFTIVSVISCMILAHFLPLKEIIEKRRRRLSVNGKTARERAFDLGGMKNAGNAHLPKRLGIKVSPLEKEISVMRRSFNRELAKEFTEADHATCATMITS